MESFSWQSWWTSRQKHQVSFMFVPSSRVSSVYHVAPTTYPILAVSLIGPDNVTLEWSQVPCASQNGPITGYTITYNTMSINVSSTNTHTLTGLTPDTVYSISIAAYNDGGRGPSSPPLINRTEQGNQGPHASLNINVPLA